MKEKPNIDCEKYRQIAQMAKMGWWESDLKNRQYICSDFIIDLLGLESDRISFEDFHGRIREDHRRRLRNEYFSLTNIETYEQMFPLVGTAAIYLVLVIILSWLLGKLERRLRQSDRR